MDEEISKLVRTVIRCGPDAVRKTVSQLQTHLSTQTETKLPGCHLSAHRDGIKALLGYANAIIVGDSLNCNLCGERLDSSVQPCNCTYISNYYFPEPTYMIGDRDFLRIRCRLCNGIVGSMEHYPKK